MVHSAKGKCKKKKYPKRNSAKYYGAQKTSKCPLPPILLEHSVGNLKLVPEEAEINYQRFHNCLISIINPLIRNLADPSDSQTIISLPVRKKLIKKDHPWVPLMDDCSQSLSWKYYVLLLMISSLTWLIAINITYPTFNTIYYYGRYVLIVPLG